MQAGFKRAFETATTDYKKMYKFPSGSGHTVNKRPVSDLLELDVTCVSAACRTWGGCNGIFSQGPVEDESEDEVVEAPSPFASSDGEQVDLLAQISFQKVRRP